MTPESWKRWALAQLKTYFDPSELKIARALDPLDKDRNPFKSRGVELIPIPLYEGRIYNKSGAAYEMLRQDIEGGLITEGMEIFLASSGRTGDDVAEMCKRLGLPCTIIMKGDTVSPKVDLLTLKRAPISVLLTPFSTLEMAKKYAAAFHGRDICQYTHPGNAAGHCKYTAPQVFSKEHGRFDIIFVPFGTTGTGRGLLEYVKLLGLSTAIVAVVLRKGQELPAGRTEESVIEAVGPHAFDGFSPPIKVTKYAAFVAAAALAGRVKCENPGPTGGEATAGAFAFFDEHMDELDRFRGIDGLVRAGIVLPDPMTSYEVVAKVVLHGEHDYGTSLITGERILEVIRSGK